MKVVVLDGYTLNPGDISWQSLESLGEVVYYDRTNESEIYDRCKNAEVIVTNKTRIDESTIKNCKRLKLICVLATGYDVIDVVAAKQLEIAVCNVPTYGTSAVGQYAIALLLEVCHRIGYHNSVVKQGKWNQISDWCFWDYPMIELDKKVIGIIGYGRIGRMTAQTAQAMGMEVVFSDPSVSSTDIGKKVPLQDLLQMSDVVVLHCPLTDDNFKLINEQTLSLMKKTAILINNSRGKLIDEEALANALENKLIYAAALDVSFNEPIANNSRLLQCDNCIITPHIAWATKEARERILDATIMNITAFYKGQHLNRIF